MTNIRDSEIYTKSFWDWTPYNECFSGTNIRISDIDGIAERHGHFLWIETKRPGQKINAGQDILHKMLTENGSFTILILWGEINDPRNCRIVYENGLVKEWQINGTEGAKEIVSRWFKWANSLPTAKQKA